MSCPKCKSNKVYSIMNHVGSPYQCLDCDNVFKPPTIEIKKSEQEILKEESKTTNSWYRN